LQFCRYAPLVRERGFHVAVEVPLQLQRVMQSLEGVDTVVSRGDALPPFDLHCPTMTLPWALRTTVETIPATLPYLRADPADALERSARATSQADGSSEG
jgi:hypothetical protein